MLSADGKPDDDRLSEWVGQSTPVQGSQLEIAQQIAKEILDADHQALERDAKFSFRSVKV